MHRQTTAHLAALLLAAGLASGVTAGASAQALPPAAGGYDLSQLPETRGVVRQYALTPRGDVDGLILQDGTEVSFPPHLGMQVVFAIKPNDTISVRGLRARAIPLIDAAQIRNEATGATIVDSGPGPRPDAMPTTIAGRVQQTLYGKRGEVNGALLDNGTIVKLPPDAAASRSDLLAPGRVLTVAGIVVSTPLGTVIDATSIGPSADAMGVIDRPPPPRGPMGKRG